MIFGHKLFETNIILSAKFYHSFFHMMLFYVVVSNAFFSFTPKLEEMIQFWTVRHIFSDGLKLNHQLVMEAYFHPINPINP